MQCSKVNTHSSKYMIILECLHVIPMSRVLTDSLTLAEAMYEKIIIFKTKLVFLKIYYRNIRYKYGTTLRGELVGELSETVMVLIRNDLLAHLPTQFSGISSFEIPFATISVFTKIPCHALTPNSRLPSAYENALCHFQNHLHNMSICIFSINYNYTHVIQHINHHPM